MKPKYEWLKIRNVFTDEYVLDDNGEFFSWEENIPNGWYKAFGKQMIEELNCILIKYNYADKYRIVQIKEKFGTIRWYDNGIPIKADKEYWDWLDKYEKLSGETCILCGDKSTHFKKGWVCPLCDKCDIGGNQNEQM